MSLSLVILLLLFIGFLLIYKAFCAGNMFEKILAVNVFGTVMVAIICVFSYISGDSEIIDIALIYALINFITTIAFLKYFKNGAFNE